MFRYVIISSELSEFFVLSAVSIFNDLALVLTSDPNPAPHIPYPQISLHLCWLIQTARDRTMTGTGSRMDTIEKNR